MLRKAEKREEKLRRARSSAELKRTRDKMVNSVSPSSLHRGKISPSGGKHTTSCANLSTQTVSEEGSTLDSNNIPHRWKLNYGGKIGHKSANKTAEGLREFPYDKKPRFRGDKYQSPDKVVAQTAEETKRYELSLEKHGLEDEDFLKLDQSKIALDHFDDADFEKHTGEEWVQLCPSGRSPLYANGEWSWQHCKVKSFDAANNMFTISFNATDRTKQVGRLNLMFDAESPELFQERVRRCHELRELSKGLVRLEYFLSRQDTHNIVPLSEPIWKEIYSLATKQLAKRAPNTENDPDFEERRIALTRDLVEEVDTAYLTTIQKSILKEAANVDPAVAVRLKELHLPTFAPQPPAPKFGKVAMPTTRSSYDSATEKVEARHYSSTHGLALTVYSLEDTWRDEFSKVLFVDTAMDHASREGTALELDAFVTRQLAHCDRTSHQLKRLWFQSVINNLLDNLTNDYNFYETNPKMVKKSGTAAVLKRFELQMADQLRDITVRSLDAIVELMRANSYAAAATEQQKAFSLNGFLAIDLVEDGEQVVLSPSREETTAALMVMLDHWVETVKGIFSVDHEMLSLQELVPSALLDVSSADPSVAADKPLVALLNERFASARKEVAAIIAADYAVACKIAELYSTIKRKLLVAPDVHVSVFVEPKLVSKKQLKAEALAAELTANASDTVANSAADSVVVVKDTEKIGTPKLVDEENKESDGEEEMEEEEEEEEETEEEELVEVFVSKDEIRDEIDSFHSLLRSIQEGTFNTESLGTLLLRCASVKAALSGGAEAQIDAFAMYALEEQQHRAESLTDEYEAILKRISKKPENEVALVALEEFLEEAKIRMVDLANEVEDVHDWHEMLESFGCCIPEPNFMLAWSLKIWPKRIIRAQAATMRALEIDKIAMIETLVKEKEDFEKALDSYLIQVEKFAQYSDYNQLQHIVSEAYALDDKLTSAAETIKNFNLRDRAFGFDLGQYPTLDICHKKFDNFYNIWTMNADFTSMSHQWLTGPFSEIEGDQVEEQVNEWWTMSYRLMKMFGSEGNEDAVAVAQHLREDSDAFKAYMPLIRALASPALRNRHWNALSDLIQEDITPDESLTVQRLIDLDIMSRMDEVETITVKAEKEFKLEKNIEEMAAEWSGIDFETMEYGSSDTYVVKGTDDIIVLLDDHIVKIQTMLGSPYVKPIKDKAAAWEKRLMYIQSLIDEMLKVQRAWMYLAPIFSSDDITRQMPTEARRFQSVDGVWRKSLHKIQEEPSVMGIASDDALVGRFVQANERLDLISKGLNDYLETKRMAFARFFFLSNDELLEIVSQTKEVRAVQPFLGKCFEGVGKVVFGCDMPDAKEQNCPRGTVFTPAGVDDVRIPRLISSEGEVIDLSIVVNPNSPPNKGNVELWLSDFEQSMRITVKEIIKMAAEVYPHMGKELICNPQRAEWVRSWPGQVVLNASQLFWTNEVTLSIEEGRVRHYCDQLNAQLLQIVHMVRGNISKMERTTLGALSVIDVHQRDVVDEMANQGINDPNSFEWLSQLRYYWEEHDDDFNRSGKDPMNMIVRILNASQMYAYEYLGNSTRLIITPLTDRCYRTLMGAVSLLYGGAPAGPAGTGKTETTKDLSKAIAIQCVVFNCSDGLDYLAMAKFFKGLAQAGAWACFDEFNRIELEVLSVIAQQILTIVKAKRARVKRFDFEGSTLSLNPDANCFITMNPGYAGRQELPDNLQALFRPCAMMVPDYALIAEIKLFSFGFEDNRNLARKLTQVLVLCFEQLSSQKHYDYGMRAVFSILVRCGVLRQQLGNVWSEPMIVLSAIVDVNEPKFTADDIPLFKGITSDLFPGVELPNPDYTKLLMAIHSVCKEDNLVPTSNFVRATIQLFETVMVRHGLMVVGETISGKTKVIHTLAKAISRIEDDPMFEGKVKISTVNPKSITQGQLYGSFDANTHEWEDGILAITYRNCAKDLSMDRQWVMFDGPVDAVWIEDMNTVLDDNKKLCLQSGEIVKMSARMTMMFEPEDLEVASPATVSRVGMVFLEQKRLGWRPLVQSWVNKLPPLLSENGASDEVIGLFDVYFEPLVFVLRVSCAIPTPVTDSELCFSVLRLLRSTLVDHFLPSVKDNGPKEPLKIVEGCFMLSMVWGIGATTDAQGQRVLDAFFKRLVTGQLDELEAWNQFVVKNPSYKNYVNEPRELLGQLPFIDSNTMYDYTFNAEKNIWVAWQDIVPTFVPTAGTKFQDIIVPTVDSTRIEWVTTQLVEHQMCVLITGATGTGKTVSLNKVLTQQLNPKYIPLFLNFSAQTSANQTQDIIDGKLDKRKKGTFGPPINKKMVIFVDDLNMPAKETYGAQPPIEILRQYMDHGGWYDRKEKSFRKLIDIQFVAAMGPPGGGRSQITQRYVRHYSMLNMIPFDGHSLTVIFGAIMDFWAKPFGPKIKASVSSMIDATVALYAQIEEELLPTPSKSHYTFNLRDLSKVFQGVSMGSPDFIKEQNQLVRLWGHECTRVFHDRLTNIEDREWFFDTIDAKTKEFFNADWKGTIAPKERPLIYGNFIDPTQLVESRAYDELSDMDKLKEVMENYLDDYNNTSSKKMTLVLFLNAIEHVARISRVLCQPQGNALLVGVGGSGRKSLTTLAVSVNEQQLFEIEISKVYGRFEWHEDLKVLLQQAGAEMKPTVFLFSDTQVVVEGFVEDINNILNTGEVPNLFNNEEQTEICEIVRPKAEKLGVELNTTSEVMQFFFKNCRQNLHVVLAFSPVGNAFRDRLRMFPSLVNCCAIDWFSEWPRDALYSVANHFLKTVESVENNPVLKKGIIDVCCDMQMRTNKMAARYYDEMRRYYYVTPTSYLELINTFKTLVLSQQSSISQRRARYANGLQKLQDTANQVADMQAELEALQPKLVIAQANTNEKLVIVKEKQTEADVQKELVQKDEAEAQEQAASCEKDKAECEEILAEAIPALQAAVKALSTLSKNDIVEVKAMKKPPPGVKITMEAVCIMMSVKPKKVPNPDGRGKIDDYWEPAQKELLGDPKFLQRLVEFDKDNIPEATIEKVKPFCDREDFTPDIIKKASVAAAGLCKWVHAMVVYEKIARVVAPKRAALAKANADLTVAMEMLRQKQAELQAVLDNLAILQQELQDTMDKKAALEAQVEDCATKLDRASRLIGGLGGEKTRWTQFVVDLGILFENSTGDVLLSSGVIAYLGVFTQKYRTDCVSEWSSMLAQNSIPCSDNYSLNQTLGEPVKIREWTINKLPNDGFSVDNAIMLFSSNRWPLMVDPQGQANRWIRNTEINNGIKVVKQTQSDFVRTLENAMSYGTPVLLENVPETLDPILEPILTKQVINKGGALTMQLGDNIVEYDSRFRFYITTKLSNPHYAPEVCVKVNLLNFVATQEGLEDQMLGITVKRETPELEAQREQLVVEDAENKRVLKEIEDKILELLAASEGNILDDEVLIATLSDSKKTGDQIMKAVAIAEKTTVKINAAREGYIPVAVVSSNLFFCVADLADVDPMYQFSLGWFTNLFNMAINRADKGKNLQERLDNLNEMFALILYSNVCRSLFEKDKLLFSFLLCIKLLQIRNEMDAIELRYFLTGNIAVKIPEPNPAPQWLSAKTWMDFLGLKDVAAFGNEFTQRIGAQDLAFWERVYNSADPEKEITDQFEESHSPFQRLLLLRCIRPDKVVPAIVNFIMFKIGEKFIEPPPFNLRSAYDDSVNITPLLFVLTPGADPMTELMRLADDLGVGSKLFAVSLGQGQGPIAERAVAEAVDRGEWVCLQNCHVATSWLSQLEKLCEELSPELVHDDFRLWLTSMPSAEFPVSVLQNGIKITLEPPKGFRANLTGSYISMEADWFENGCTKPDAFKKLAYGICFFHTVVRERCRFGPLGWNIPYTFSVPDLRISLDQLQLFLNTYEAIPFKMLAYLAGECNYGGRVTDDKDRRALLTVLSDFYTSDILDDNYKFSPSGVFFAPPSMPKLQNYLDFIKTLPFVEPPEIFGLHENADITSAIAQTNEVLGTALTLQPRATGGEGKSWAETVMELATDIERKIPGVFDVDKARVLYPVRFDEAMNSVVVQELERFNRLITVVKTSLESLKLAIRGMVVLSRDLEAVGNNMTNMLVPSMWDAASYPSLKPLGSYVNDLLLRLEFMQTWIDEDKPPVYWLSGFYFIPGFLTGTRQNFARRYTIPIDLIKFTFELIHPDEVMTQGPEDGCYINGLFLEGAAWDADTGTLMESKPKELFVQMPVIKLIPTETKNIKPSDAYECPVYKTTKRQGMLSTTGHSTNFVMFISVPVPPEYPAKHYIKRACAMICSLSE